MPQPDLPARIKNDVPFTKYDRETFYSAGSPVGYVDYPFADEEAEENYRNPRQEKHGGRAFAKAIYYRMTSEPQVHL